MSTAERSVKEHLIQIIREQPEDSSYDDILRELAFAKMVDRGLEDVASGRTVENEEMERTIDSWGE